jgi:hypothetical protein
MDCHHGLGSSPIDEPQVLQLEFKKERGLLNLSQNFIILSQILSPAVSEFTNPPQEGGRRPCHFRLRLAAAEFLLRDY